jgi:hypothetical protein
MSGGRLARFGPALALGCVVLALYGRALGRPFTSEDFLLIRYLGQNPPWHHLFAQLSSPWLGISVVKFYRPVSTLFYGVEIAAFGGQPLGYNLVHLLLHGVNVALVWAVVRRLDRLTGEAGTLTPWAVALLFAIYPLHPNAVVFGASFATLYGAAFVLGSLLVYQSFRETGSRTAWGASMALFVLALGSYEESAVLPALLVAYDHLVGVRVASGRRHAALPVGYLPFFGVLGLYLLLRRQIFGVFVGGYDEYSQRLLAPQLRQMARDLAASTDLLHLPVFDREPSHLGAVLCCLLLGAAPLALWWLRRGSLGAFARLWLFAWAWTLAVQVPFAFRPCVPGNGRYWYLAAAGVAMSAVFLARGLFAAVRPPWRSLAPAAVGLLALVWADLLAGEVSTYIAAGRTARTIQGELLRVPRTPEIFLTRYPYFLENAARVPIAQVFHYGVWDSVQPPFVKERVDVYPLPPLAGAELLPVDLGAPESPVYEWDERTRTMRPFVFDFRAERRPVEFETLRPADGAVVDPARDVVEVAVPPGAHAKLRLVLVTRINGAVFDLDPTAVVEGRVHAALPREILQASDRLYGKGLHYWWIEGLDADGRVSGFSRMRSFHLAD